MTNGPLGLADEAPTKRSQSAHGAGAARGRRNTTHTQPHWAGELPKAEARETSAVSETGGPMRPRDAPERETEGKGGNIKELKALQLEGEKLGNWILSDATHLGSLYIHLLGG